MQTEHRFIFQDSRKLDQINDQSIHLVVTSPPYPMIEMWDRTFMALNGKIGSALFKGDYHASFELMHQELDKVWKELYRVLQPGGFACINIGDATRSDGVKFQLFPNHYRILQTFWELGFDVLPLILWRKQTNAPTKFMGSGMLPAGAYVTLEHEYILIFRKGNKRVFQNEKEETNRRESAYFWEERNNWFSDIWDDLKGTRQKIKKKDMLRLRSGAFPFLLPYRLINMYSVYNDTVLDPFAGTGTTNLAALACGRNSVGYEIDPGFLPLLEENFAKPGLLEQLNNCCYDRIRRHKEFIEEYSSEKGQPPKYINSYFKFPVVTNQETKLKLFPLKQIIKTGEGCYTAAYESEYSI